MGEVGQLHPPGDRVILYPGDIFEIVHSGAVREKIHRGRDLVAEFRPYLLKGDVRVLHRVVQEGRDLRRFVLDHGRHRTGMGYVREAGLIGLPFMRLRGERIRFFHQVVHRIRLPFP